MTEYPQLHVYPENLGAPGFSNNWGEFIKEPDSRWGPWRITLQPKKLVELKEITLLECSAHENVEDEQGVSAQGSLAFDPCDRHFLVGQAADGTVIWWYLLGMHRYDLKKGEFCEAGIRIESGKVIIKGYGWEVEPDVEIALDIKTGVRVSVS
jgi:hypothetical protein